MPLKKTRRYPKDYQHPPCTVCDKPVPQRPNEARHEWAGRSCCSSDCVAEVARRLKHERSAALWLAATLAHPPCVICAGPVTRRPTSKEPLARYTERACCLDEVCRKEHHSRQAKKSAADRRANGTAFREHTTDRSVGYEIKPIDFGGGFALHDVIEPPSLGRVLRGMPLHHTPGGVARYG